MNYPRSAEPSAITDRNPVHRDRLRRTIVKNTLKILAFFLLAACSTESAPPAPGPAPTPPSASTADTRPDPDLLPGLRRPSGPRPQPPIDPRTPQQIARAACGGKCVGSMVKPLVSASGAEPIPPAVVDGACVVHRPGELRDVRARHEQRNRSHVHGRMFRFDVSERHRSDRDVGRAECASLGVPWQSNRLPPPRSVDDDHDPQ